MNFEDWFDMTYPLNEDEDMKADLREAWDYGYLEGRKEGYGAGWESGFRKGLVNGRD
jgi:hypothetical protein